MKKQYTFDEFTDIIKELRSEHGCPWDREQTHNSLKPCISEETAELLAAIRIYDTKGNYENITARTDARDQISKFIFKETGKRPMILPVIIEVKEKQNNE